MPGLSQLKKFNSDLLALGDEITIRASRGEKPVAVEIPKTIEDKNDSEEFVLGMPEIEAEVEALPVDEDLSDLTGLGGNTQKSSDNKEEAASAFAAPDLSSLLNPISVTEESADAGMPDLSMFMEEEAPQEEVVEEEPEEVSIADMGLDALLAGGGFDADETEQESEPEPEKEELNIDDFKEVNTEEITEEPEAIEEIEELEDDGLSEIERDLLNSVGADATPADEPAKEEPSLDDLLGNIDSTPKEDVSAVPGDAILDFDVPDVSDNKVEEPVESLDELEDLGDLDSLETPADVETPVDDLGSPTEDFSLPVDDLTAPTEDLGAPLEDFSLPAEDLEAPLEDLVAPTEDFSLPVDDLTAPTEDLGAQLEDFGLPAEDMEAPAEDLGAPTEDFSLPVDDLTAPTEDLDAPLEDFSLPAEDLEAPAEDLGAPTEDFSLPVDDLTAPTEDLGAPLEDFSLPAEDLEAPAEDLGAPTEDFSLPVDDLTAPTEDLGAPLEDFGLPAEDMEAPAEDLDAPTEDFGIPTEDESASIPDGLFNAGDVELDDLGVTPEENSEPTPVDFNMDEEIPDYEDGGLETPEINDDISDDFDEGEAESEGPIEVFDAPEMEGLDFGIQDTDSQLDGGDAASFDLGSNDEFAMEGEFEIPGFSDVATAKEEKSAKTPLATGKDKGKGKKSKVKNLPEPDFTGAEESEDLPPNTLSDAQYKVFLKNLSEYPLNVRLAFEDFIVQNEFTDDAEFEIIEKILNKAPARSVASLLEKMLDTSIPVPRDFEHRTAEEYEAYKKSLSYQLKNKIIPGILVGIVMLFVGWGLFNFTKNCIVYPLKANKYYKQGYTLLQADEYPQSEMKFEQAVKYRINKNWFYKYARGYREHKQYQRAAKMYQNILYCYNHDKDAGLEYADMELNDLANYERAEEIVRREVLDYHINDADGILKLGDVFLEWGTEKDPAKLESAREQYATLLQLYKPNDLYLSRMMRYFIRSDNLRQVLQMKQNFEKEKQLGYEDWTELSGYLLDKYYGTLAPSEEYLRYEIEGLRGLLLRAVKTNPNNPIALYNLSRYFIKTDESGSIEPTLQRAIENFNTVPSMKKRDIYKYIDSYRLLGEHYIATTDYLQAQEQFAEGITLFTTERDNAGFEGTPQIGKLYEDMGNIKYTISGDYDDALINYKYSVELENDNPSIRYRIGYIQYNNNNYAEALGSFMKAGDGNVKDRNLLLAMANTLSLRDDDYAAQGYYNQLIEKLDEQIAERGIVLPQTVSKDYDIVNTYLYAANNYGVTLYRLAKRTGNSALNAQAIVQFSQSIRAWDALTRNQETMVRLPGSNLAEANVQYITHPIPNFEPSVYTNIPKTLYDNEHL